PPWGRANPTRPLHGTVAPGVGPRYNPPPPPITCAASPYPLPSRDNRSGEPIPYQSLPLHAPLGFTQEAPAFGDLTQQVRGTPARTVALMPGRDLVVDLAGADRVGPIHQSAMIAREAEAVEPHHVDIAGADGLAFLQDLARLVDGGEEQPAQDLLVRKALLLKALFLGHLGDDGVHLRIDDGRAVAFLVAIPAPGGLLTEPSQLHQAIGNRQTPVAGIGGAAALSRV